MQGIDLRILEIFQSGTNKFKKQSAPNMFTGLTVLIIISPRTMKR